MEISNSISLVSINIKEEPEAFLKMLDNLVGKEKDKLIEGFEKAYKCWLNIASDNVLSKLSGISTAERQSLKIILINEMMHDRLEEVLLELYNHKGFKNVRK